MSEYKDGAIASQRRVDGAWSLEDSGHGEERQDSADMYHLGRSQQLDRNFQPFSTLGLTCVVMGTWVGMTA